MKNTPSSREALRKRTDAILDGLSVDELVRKVESRVMGQDDAVQKVCGFLVTALRRVSRLAAGVDPASLPHLSCLMVEGPSGCGKTFAIETACEALGGIPVHRIDGSQLTGAGWRGDDIEIHLRDIARTQAETHSPIVVFIDEADKLARDEKDAKGFDPCPGLLRVIEGDDVISVRKADKDRDDNHIPLDKAGLIFVFAGAFTGLDEITRARLLEESGGRAAGFTASSGAMGLSSLAPEELRGLSDPKDLKTWGLPAELVGRITSLVRIRPLEVADMLAIARGGEASVESRFASMMPAGCAFLISDEVAEHAAVSAVRTGGGARGVEASVSAVACQAIEAAEKDEGIVSCRLVMRDGAPEVEYERGQRKGASKALKQCDPEEASVGPEDMEELRDFLEARKARVRAEQKRRIASCIAASKGFVSEDAPLVPANPMGPSRWQSIEKGVFHDDVVMTLDVAARLALSGGHGAPDPLQNLRGHSDARHMAKAFALVFLADLSSLERRLAYELVYGLLTYQLDHKQLHGLKLGTYGFMKLAAFAVKGELSLLAWDLHRGVPQQSSDEDADCDYYLFSLTNGAAARAPRDGADGNSDASLRHLSYFLALGGEEGPRVACRVYGAALTIALACRH